MIVVSDTSPLNYLVLIEHAQVLPLLFGRVVALKQTSFRVSDPVLDGILQRDADRRRQLSGGSDSGGGR
jgi:predicted nucleic acid-binding protein